MHTLPTRVQPPASSLQPPSPRPPAPQPPLTCVLGGADAVAVALLVHGARHPGGGQPPVGAERVGGDGRVGPVQRPLAGVAVAGGGPGLGGASGGGV